MITTIITLLIALNLLSQPADWENLSPQEQEEMIEVVENDVIAF